jgi:hypothetical protein
MIRPALRGASLAALLVLSSAAAGQAAPRPDAYAIQNVRLERAAEGRRATLILKDGRVEALLEPEAALPFGVRVIDGGELLALPAFIDAFTHTGFPAPAPVADRDVPVDVREDVAVDMRSANRKGIAPDFKAVEKLALDAAAVKAWTDQGFGVLLAAPGGQLLAGDSALVAVREAAARDLVIEPDVHAHAAFEASGPGYPSTLMGYHAQLRQFFLDTKRQAELEQRYQQGRPGARPAYDADLAAALPICTGQRLLVCEAQTARDVERWLGLAREFGLKVAIAGGRDAWKVADRLAVADVPVTLTLDWGEEVEDPSKPGKKDEPAEEQAEKPGEEGAEQASQEKSQEGESAPGAQEGKEKKEKQDDPDEAWTYVEPLGVRAERRREWEEKRDSAIGLQAAGVRLSFGTGSSGKPAELMEHVRALVEAGLPADAALEALTAGGAAAVGAEKHLGRIAPGMDATLVLWKGDPLTDKKAEPAWVFVDGFALERELKKEKEKGKGGGPAQGVTAAGTWNLTLTGEGAPEDVVLKLTMEEDGTVTGTYSLKAEGEEQSSEVEGRLEGVELSLEGTFDLGDQSAPFTLTATLAGDTLSGSSEIELPGLDEPARNELTGVRAPGASQREGGLR